MAGSNTSFLNLTTLILLTILPLLASGYGETGSNRNDTNQCVNTTEAELVYSPFKPYSTWFNPGHVKYCWLATDCLFEMAGESRKQQFAATALVMGLIPLTLREIKWPKGGTVYVTKPLNAFIEVLVLALGLVPSDTNDPPTGRANRSEGMNARTASKHGRYVLVLKLALCSITVLASYTGLVVMEVYSKRSALDCVFPGWIAAWHGMALVPAAVHSLSARRRRTKPAMYQPLEQITVAEDGTARAKQADSLDAWAMGGKDAERKRKVVSAPQAAMEDWQVQLFWGLYSISGTLVFTSIMAVTVIEMVCWTLLAATISGASRILAFFICVAFEDEGVSFR